MLIFTVDDEPMLLKQSETALQAAVPTATVRAFRRASDALSAVTEGGMRPDAVFTDIEMPGMDGLAFAEQLRTLCPQAAVIFVTGYSEYAVSAYQVHAHGYVLKPLEPLRIREELEAAGLLVGGEEKKLTVHCFGYFEVFWKGAPLLFSRRQTKELFAFLVDRAGKASMAEEIITALWEDETDMTVAKTRLRNLVFDLKNTLEAIGMEDVLIRRSGQMAVRRELLDCDYYRLLDGDKAAQDAFCDEYMTQYSWAEETAGALYFRVRKER